MAAQQGEIVLIEEAARTNFCSNSESNVCCKNAQRFNLFEKRMETILLESRGRCACPKND